MNELAQIKMFRPPEDKLREAINKYLQSPVRKVEQRIAAAHPQHDAEEDTSYVTSDPYRRLLSRIAHYRMLSDSGNFVVLADSLPELRQSLRRHRKDVSRDEAAHLREFPAQLYEPSSWQIVPHWSLTQTGDLFETAHFRLEPLSAVTATSDSTSTERDLVLSEKTIDLLRLGIELRRHEGGISPLMAAFDALAQDDKTFSAQVVEIIENMFVTIGEAYGEKRWTATIASKGRFSSEVGEEFRVRFPLPYDLLPLFMAEVFRDFTKALLVGYTVRGDWGRFVFDPATLGITIEPQ